MRAHPSFLRCKGEAVRAVAQDRFGGTDRLHLTDLIGPGRPPLEAGYPFRTFFSFAPAAACAIAASKRAVRLSIATSMSATVWCSL